jgi:hypothetical protein
VYKRQAKGHLGAMLVQKAETTISLAKSETTPGASDIVPEYTRNKEFPSMEMTITGYDTIELVQKDDFESAPERVWTIEDHKRLAPMIEGKTTTDAVKFIADTEGVLRRIAEKALNEMEATNIIQYKKVARSRVVELTNPI